MGLFYMFPNSDEREFVLEEGNTIFLRTFGLPYIYWLYVSISFIFSLFLFSWTYELVLKLFSSENFLDKTLGGFVIITLLTILSLLVSFLFYEKRISFNKEKMLLKISHNIFNIGVKVSYIYVSENSPFKVVHHIDAINLRSKKKHELVTNYETGYYELYVKDVNNQLFYLDRNPFKKNLIFLKEILDQ